MKYLDNISSLLSQPFAISHFPAKKVLVAGVGGGCDIITAFALTELLFKCNQTKAVYANTKTKVIEPLEHVTPHILKVPAQRIVIESGTRTHGTTLIDQSVPRGPDGCPWILQLSGTEEGKALLSQEIKAMAFDLCITVDTGCDSIIAGALSGPIGRDRRMLEAFRKLETPWIHVVAAPGCDGEVTFEKLQETLAELSISGQFLGCISLLEAVPSMREMASPLKFNRTTNIIVRAASQLLQNQQEDQLVEIPRGLRPKIPTRWLTVALVFDLQNQRH